MIVLNFPTGAPSNLPSTFWASVITQACIAQPSLSDMVLSFNSEPDPYTINLDHSRTPTADELTAIRDAYWSAAVQVGISFVAG